MHYIRGAPALQGKIVIFLSDNVIQFSILLPIGRSFCFILPVEGYRKRAQPYNNKREHFTEAKALSMGIYYI